MPVAACNIPAVHTHLFLCIILNFELALHAQLCIIVSACVCSTYKGCALAAVQLQPSYGCQWFMAYHQVGSNCFQTQRPEQKGNFVVCTAAAELVVIRRN